VDLRDLILIALPFIVAITLGVGFLLVFRERAAANDVLRRRAQLAEPDLATPLRDPKPRSRPWWGNPFIWVWRPRRGRDVDPRANGHEKREDPSSLGG
jgi:hypothetical protein